MRVTTVHQNIERRVYELSEWDVKEACREYVLRSPVFAEHPDLDHVIRVDLLEDDDGACLAEVVQEYVKERKTPEEAGK